MLFVFKDMKQERDWGMEKWEGVSSGKRKKLLHTHERKSEKNALLSESLQQFDILIKSCHFPSMILRMMHLRATV